MKCFQSEFEKDLGEEDKTECQKKVLSENVSTLTLKYTTMVSILLGLALVVFQIVAIVASLPLSFLGAGIWLGIYYIFGVNLVGVILIRKKSVRVYKALKKLEIFGVVLGLGLIVINILAIGASCKTNSSCGSDLWINCLILVLGGLIVILNLSGFLTLVIRCREEYKLMATDNVFTNNPKY